LSSDYWKDKLEISALLFSAWQGTHNICRFSGSHFPPLKMGIIWSTVISRLRMNNWQAWHWLIREFINLLRIVAHRHLVIPAVFQRLLIFLFLCSVI
jgi:hypothetical protein